jgi:transposase
MIKGDGIFMSKQEQFVYEIINDFIKGKMSREEVATLLEMSCRNVTRVANKVRNKGVLGVKHGNTGRRPANKLDRQKKLAASSLLKEHYFDFNIAHARDMLRDNHDLSFSYTSLRRVAHENNLVKHRKKSRKKVRKYRVRMPIRGLMLQMDGSRHAWNG